MYSNVALHTTTHYRTVFETDVREDDSDMENVANEDDFDDPHYVPDGLVDDRVKAISSNERQMENIADVRIATNTRIKSANVAMFTYMQSVSHSTRRTND